LLCSGALALWRLELETVTTQTSRTLRL